MMVIVICLFAYAVITAGVAAVGLGQWTDGKQNNWRNRRVEGARLAVYSWAWPIMLIKATVKVAKEVLHDARG